MQYCLRHIKEQCMGAEIVSFDLFDTLIFRTVDHPQDIFDMVESVFNESHAYGISNFKQERIKAENKARKRSCQEEVVLSEIYQYLPYAKDDRQCLMDIERKIEIENSIPNRGLIQVLLEMKDKGKQILIITDMYLERETIRSILRRHKIPYDYLFISSEECCTKLSGKLYRIALERLHINPNNMLHIGDNPVTDGSSAEQNHIRSCIHTLNAPMASMKLYGKKQEKCIQAIHLKKIVAFSMEQSKENESEFRVGYTILGPLLYEYCRWLRKNADSRNIDNIFFIAREGYLLKRMYETIFPEDKHRLHYLRLNKNVLRLPYLFLETGLSAFLETVPYRKQYSYSDIFSFLGLHENTMELRRRMDEFSICPDSLISHDEMESEEFDAKYHSFRELLKEEMQEQTALLLSYLEENRVFEGKAAFVNNSINGNMQNMLEKILSGMGLRANFYGFQFDESDQCRELLNDRFLAWLPQMGVSAFWRSLFSNYSVVFEHLLFENKGTAVRFYKKEKGICVLCDQLGMEELNQDCLEGIQKYAVKFALDYKSHVPINLSHLAINHFFEFFFHPIKEDAVTVGRFYDRDFDGEKRLLDFGLLKEKDGESNIGSVLADYGRIRWPFGQMALMDWSERRKQHFLKIKNLKRMAKIVKMWIWESKYFRRSKKYK